MNKFQKLHKPFYFDDTVWGANTWPLLSVVYSGDINTVNDILDGDPNWLLDHGADIDQAEPEFCSTSLGWAARWGRTAMAKLLLQ